MEDIKSNTIKENIEICNSYIAKASLLGECKFIFGINNNKKSKYYNKISLIFTKNLKYSELKIPDFVDIIGVDMEYEVSNIRSMGGLVEFSGTINPSILRKLGYTIIPEIEVEIKNSFSNSFGKYIYAFDSESLDAEKIVLGKNVERINTNTFRLCKIKDMIINKNLRHISNNAFSSCEKLERINLNDMKLNSYIGSNAFYSCISLKDIDLRKIKRLNNGAFMLCSNIKSIKLPDLESFNEIKEDTFWGCYEIKELVIPDNIKYIRNGAFRNTSGLIRINIGKGVKFIEDGAFYNYSLNKDVINIAIDKDTLKNLSMTKKSFGNREIEIKIN